MKFRILIKVYNSQLGHITVGLSLNKKSASFSITFILLPHALSAMVTSQI